MTEQEFIDRLIAKTMQNINLTWSDVTTTIGGTSAENKSKLLAAINSNNQAAIGQIITGLLLTLKRSKATAAVNARIIDGKVAITDLLALYD